MRVGPKFDAFIDCDAPVEFLEGTTFSGKTTVGVWKFMLNVAESPKRQHIIAGLDLGTVEKNIITKDHGILDEWGKLVQYFGNGTRCEKMPHILFSPAPGVDKVIYILGYDDKKRWKKALGGQYGCLYIDEVNIADMDFVREAAMRCDYLMCTLNPDDPSLPIYSEYINCSRPLPEWADGTPPEILSALSEPAKPGWVHWFFTFDDNISVTPEKKAQIMLNVPKGTKLWKNKILGLRGRATGLVFSNFSRQVHVKDRTWARQYLRDAEEFKKTDRKEFFKVFTGGLDTAYSVQSEDTFAMTFLGITNKGRCVCLDEDVINNRDKNKPLAPSDMVQRFSDFLEKNRREWGFARAVFIDSADQATITEANKFKLRTGSLYEFTPAWKKTRIIDRIYLQLGWFVSEGKEADYYVLDHCTNYIGELETYSWNEDKINEPEDGHDHCINSAQYAWLPYKTIIGVHG